MKTLSFNLFLLFNLFFVNLIFSQTPVKIGSSIVFDELTFDYGIIDSAANGSHVFTFKNNGDEDLLISEVKSSCGCTVPEWTKTPIAPGETGSIIVSYNTTKIGPINKSVLVLTNAKIPENGMVNLRIKGEVVKNKN